jgi:hypothetical protein
MRDVDQLSSPHSYGAVKAKSKSRAQGGLVRGRFDHRLYSSKLQQQAHRTHGLLAGGTASSSCCATVAASIMHPPLFTPECSAVLLKLGARTSPREREAGLRSCRTARRVSSPHLSDCEASVHRAVFEMPVPVGSMPQGARGPSTLDKRMQLRLAWCCRPANSAQ